MNDLSRNIGEPYLLALKDYLSHGKEEALKQAYELGRKAVADRIGVLEMITVHEEALGAILSETRESHKSRKMIRVTEFFAEILSPFDMVQRGLHEAYNTLTDLHKTLKRQNQELIRLLNVLDASSNEIYMFDVKTLHFLYVNARVLRNFGCSLENVQKMSPLDLILGYDETAFKSLLYPLLEGQKKKLVVQTQHCKSDGSEYPVEEHFQLIEQGQERICLVVTLDLTERKQMEVLTHLAYHDNLTGLPNRLLFQDRLQHALQTGRRDLSTTALLLLDLNRFKEVNDDYGHDKGDAVLQQLGPRLHSVLRESDTLARLGGDEFAVLLPSTSIEGTELAVNKILEIIEQPFSVESARFEIGASIGIALFPWHGTTADLLMRRADAAMYAAKKVHGGYKIYSPDCDSSYRKPSIEWKSEPR
ncbi:MAG: diguanylate cyclase [Nitrospirae bacterium]|nr:diguanylate cyclase [Nitrospirota bacterium]MBI3593721.1 diguanylate cyclase [Nitrospirota bacterium]